MLSNFLSRRRSTTIKPPSSSQLIFRTLKEGDPKKLVICINGFLQEDDQLFSDWMSGVDLLNPEATCIGVNWLSEAALPALMQIMNNAIFNNPLVSHGSAAKTMIKSATAVLEMNKIWNKALLQSEIASKALASWLCEQEGAVTLLGHSLGARIACLALEHMGDTANNTIERVILLGGAIENQKVNINSQVAKTVINCHSDKDQVLKTLFRIAVRNKDAIGTAPLNIPEVTNINCTDIVSLHTSWKKHLTNILMQHEPCPIQNQLPAATIEAPAGLIE